MLLPALLTALAQRLGVSEAGAATMVTPLEEKPVPLAETLVTAPASPLVPMTGRNGASSAPKTLLNRPAVKLTVCLSFDPCCIT